MKTIIRSNVFESNSSSTHSLIICTEEEYDKLKNEEMVVDTLHEKAIPIEQARAVVYDTYGENCDIDKNGWRESTGGDIESLEEWEDSEYLDYDETHYTSPSGDRIVVLDKYGWVG